MLSHENTFDSWTHFMQRGDFRAAWKVSDIHLQKTARTSSVHLPRHFQSIWNGTPLNGKRVLIRCYHGLGDSIQFARYLPMVEKIAAETTVWLQPELIPLVSTMQTKCRLLELNDFEPGVDYDVDVESMELPFVFRTTLQSIPANIPYIHVKANGCIKSFGPAVGIVWRGGDWDMSRDIPFSMIERLMQIPGIDFHILQRGPALADLKEAAGIVSGSDDLFAAAQIIKSLDLVITIDSMPAHLAGAMGVPVWTLLHAICDWRWMLDRSDCPWYPTMRLFRQKQPGQWQDVIDEVARELITLRDHKQQFADTPKPKQTVLPKNGKVY